MKKTKLVALSIPMLTLMILFAGCGKDGDPGPQGTPGAQGPAGESGPAGRGSHEDYSTAFGSVQGTLSGNRLDGTAFTETFNFNLASLRGRIKKYDDGVQLLSADFTGLEDNNFIGLSLNYDNNTVSFGSNSSFYFSFLKELSNNRAFYLRATPHSEPIKITWPIDPALNEATYHFVFKFHRYGGLAIALDDDSNFIFKTQDGSTVTFSNTSSSNGKFVQIKSPDGTISTSSAIYGGLTFQDSGFEDQNGASLSTAGVISPDIMDISDFSYNTETGALKFNFVMHVGADIDDYYSNTTQHPLTITGKVDATIYTSILSRERN